MTTTKKVLIIGGVAGGASAAARLRRLDENAQIMMFERGPYISFANCGLPYHIGGAIKDRNRLLVQTPEKMKQRFNIDVRTQSEVTAIDRQAKQVTVHDLKTERYYHESYDTLVLSPGAEPVRPPLPGNSLPGVYTLRNIPDMDAIKQHIEHKGAKKAVIVGGGYIGLEMAEALVERGLKVSLVELAGQVMGTVDPEMAAPLHQELELHGTQLYLGCSLTEITAAGEGLNVLLSTGEAVETDLVILAIGVRAESRLAKEAGLEIGQRGGIVVNERMQTSDPAVYAVGDAVEVEDFVGGYQTLIPLAGPANRQGRIAADNICGRDSTYHKTQGTAICKVFNLAVAVTGMNEKSLKRTGINYQKVYVHPASHAGYYPGASQISLKLLYDPAGGKILGAQAVGTKGVDKRIDVLAVAIRAGLTVYDLQDMELSYAPPYGSAKDPINYAGFAAVNSIKGDAPICHTEDILALGENQLLLDVRTPDEAQAGTISGAVNIPVDDLRNRLGELSRDKEIIAFCQVGLRGYLACRILMQKGFKCCNLSGGYVTYAAAKGIRKERAPVQKEMTSDTGGVEESLKQKTFKIALHTDACGLQCPGPIVKLKEAIDKVQLGQAVSVAATDPGFASDIRGWCSSTGHTLHSVMPSQGRYEAVVVKAGAAQALPAAAASKNKTIVVFSGDFDKAMAAFIIANGAASMGGQVTLFFTFWGLNLLRRPEAVAVKKTAVERMFGWMMPRGAEKTSLSKMNMAGMGTLMIKGIMKNKNVMSLSELIVSAKAAGVRLVACSMSMDLMGIKKEELIEGVQEGGVAAYLNQAEAAGVNLFI